MDAIHIDGLKIFARHGVFEEEKKNGQDFYVNAALYTDTERAGSADDLTQTVDYGSVCEAIKKVMTENIYDLIETAAQEVAYAILRGYGLVRSVDIEIKKPHAPIAMEFESVSVKIHRGWNMAVLSVGSNMGDKRAYIEAAVSRLRESGMIRNVAVSELITTEPYGYTEQDEFLNGAVTLETLYSPDTLLGFLHELENQAERKREIHWGPRTLDLDIVFFDDEVIHKPHLIIPHPDMQNRDFVLKPLAELIPHYIHPVLRKSVGQLLDELEKRS